MTANIITPIGADRGGLGGGTCLAASFAGSGTAVVAGAGVAGSDSAAGSVGTGDCSALGGGMTSITGWGTAAWAAGVFSASDSMALLYH